MKIIRLSVRMVPPSSEGDGERMGWLKGDVNQGVREQDRARAGAFWWL